MNSELYLPQHGLTIGFHACDRAVIEYMHRTRVKADLKPYDSVRGVFWEGSELYPSAGFKEKSHVQLCVRNPNCIKGYFRPLGLNDDFDNV